MGSRSFRGRRVPPPLNLLVILITYTCGGLFSMVSYCDRPLFVVCRRPSRVVRRA